MGKTVRDQAPSADMVEAAKMVHGLWVIDQPKNSHAGAAVQIEHVTAPFVRPGYPGPARVGVMFTSVDAGPYYVEIDAASSYRRATDDEIAQTKATKHRAEYVARLRHVAEIIEANELPVAAYPGDLTVARDVTFAQLLEVRDLSRGELVQEYGATFAVRVPGGPAHEFAAEWRASLTLEQVAQVAPDKVGRCDVHGLWLVTPRTPASACPVCSGLCTAGSCGHPVGEHDVNGCTAMLGAKSAPVPCPCKKTDSELTEAAS